MKIGNIQKQLISEAEILLNVAMAYLRTMTSCLSTRQIYYSLIYTIIKQNFIARLKPREFATKDKIYDYTEETV